MTTTLYIMQDYDEALMPSAGEKRRTVFPVCSQHKRDFFVEYPPALVSLKDRCVLCNPRKNDSLGG